ncbi:uncharacterized protein LOC122377020 [Amphibalanus amphitrite]|uniref:uncharacterized protein LOC122377020 n=1 Tax=Amphibalanus amphitrite TaxID=1232801 RepID=UPI001C91116B|nr:uncharacterized protein LOC122377020 [Amphibalanus amphitrite]
MKEQMLDIEHLFSIESLGIREVNESVSSQERQLVEKFTEEVEFKDGKYYIKVPFYDNVKDVPGNYEVALATMKKTDEGIKTYRFRTILFGLNCSPFILNHIIQLHLERYSSSVAATALKESLYVDNFIFSTSDPQTLFNIYNNSRQIMMEGGFNLRSWMSNHPQLVDIMASEDTIHQHDAPVEKVLGYFYDSKQDVVSLADFSFEERPQGITKRQLLSNISKVFDPLSLALPVTIRGRLLMKQVWKDGTAWDEEVTPEVYRDWKLLKNDLNYLREIKFPRKTGDTEIGQPTELHLFCDGSKTCYGFACYVKQENSEPQLVFAKSKLAPDDKSIPQLELLAVFLALKCLPLILDSIKMTVDHLRLWSDAQVVLEWLTSGCKSKSRFTSNRLEDITSMKLKLQEQYNCDISHHYVATTSNVADMLTRGLTAKEFVKKTSLWLHGPDWLGGTSGQWPTGPLYCLSDEARRAVDLQSQQVTIEPSEQQSTQPIINVNDFSSLKRLYGVTAMVFQFINKLKHRQADAREQAKVYWLKTMQEESFVTEISYLQAREKGKTTKSTIVPKLLTSLNGFLDETGTLRCRGRLSKLNKYSYAVHNPVLLSKDHRLTVLMINDQHRRCKHLGVGTTLTELRESGHWIPGGRQAVKRIIKDCITCRKLNALAFDYPKMTSLPKERLSFIKPFNNTAIDYTGHIFVQDEGGDMKKMYVVLYTCLAIRCIHLDLVPDLSLKSFLQSFRRFCSTYCVPEFLYTDNAKQFLASQRVLNNIFISDEFQEHLTQHNIKHRTIPVYASWVGGVYERQIKTVKHCLYKSVGRAKLDYFELLTQLMEIQNMVNCRPITYVHSGIDDIEPLTPNKILKLHTNPRLHLAEYPEDADPLWTSTPDDTHQQLNNTLQEQQRLQDQYKKMWHSEYLLGLRETTRDIFQTDWKDKISFSPGVGQ